MYETKNDDTHSFEPLEFLARLSAHIPDKWESTTRYYGRYSHRVRGARAKQLPEGASTGQQIFSPDIDKPRASKTWAALIKRVFEIDPLICPKCSGAMKVKSFITDTAEVRRLLENLKIAPFIKPVPLSARSPPEADAVF